MDKVRTVRRIRLLLGVFMFCLVASGLTAFPLVWETRLLAACFGEGTRTAALFPSLAWWLSHVREGLDVTYGSYPFIAYGTDWLAFAHVVIGIAFWGPLKDPVKNQWVVEFGMIACILVIPLALVCGPIRGIPWFWRLIDCSFGVVGLLVLWIVRRMTVGLAKSERR